VLEQMRNALTGLLRIKMLAPLIMTVALIGIFQYLSPHLLSARNLRSIVELLPELGLITIAVSILIVSGEFDLSVGAVLALSPLIGVRLMQVNVPPWIAIVLALGCCAAIGAIQGGICLRWRIPSFIVTLAGLMVWRGVVLVTTRGFPLSMPAEASGVVAALSQRVGMFRIGFFYFIAFTLVLWLMLERTRFGNWVFAVGGNEATAHIRGVNPRRVKMMCFVLCSVLAGFAGLVQASRLGVALATAGSQYELMAIAGAVIGGVSLAGGKGTIIGAAIGAFVIQLIQNGLILARVPGYWFQFFVGVVIVVAVVVGQLGERMKAKWAR